MRSQSYIPLLFVVLGVTCWVLGCTVVNDKDGGKNIALTLIGAGGGLAKQGSEENTVKTGRVDNITIAEESPQRGDGKPDTDRKG